MRSKHSPRTSTPAATAGVLRIIGGRWRGRKLRFPAVPGLRPTPDRVRETLFNWLMLEIPGARCLDLFAGSGALGLEALSRGAASTTFVERDRGAAEALRGHLAALEVGAAAQVQQADALRWLEGPAPAPGEGFDVVFLDPPFDLPLLEPACRALQDRGWLAPRAWVYLERRSSGARPALPAGFQPHRSREAGQVSYELYRVCAEEPEAISE